MYALIAQLNPKKIQPDEINCTDIISKDGQNNFITPQGRKIHPNLEGMHWIYINLKHQSNSIQDNRGSIKKTIDERGRFAIQIDLNLVHKQELDAFVKDFNKFKINNSEIESNYIDMIIEFREPFGSIDKYVFWNKKKELKFWQDKV